MPPCREHSHHFSGELTFFQEHLEYLVTEDGFHLFEFQRRRDAKHSSLAIDVVLSLPKETTVRQENMAVRIKAEEVAKGLDSNDSAGNGCLFRYPDTGPKSGLHKNLHGFPRAEAEPGKKFPVIQEVSVENLRDAENEMTVRHLLEDIHTKPLAECHDALLTARRAEVATLVPLRRDFRFASTQMPAGIHGRSLCI
jgi:hypothetical protein